MQYCMQYFRKEVLQYLQYCSVDNPVCYYNSTHLVIHFCVIILTSFTVVRSNTIPYHTILLFQATRPIPMTQNKQEDRKSLGLQRKTLKHRKHKTHSKTIKTENEHTYTSTCVQFYSYCSFCRITMINSCSCILFVGIIYVFFIL